MTRQPVEFLVVGKRELISNWKTVAANAGLLIEREWMGTLSAGIKRGEIGLDVEVVASVSWEPWPKDMFGLFINTKEKFDDAQVFKAKRLVLDFVSAFDSDALATSMLAKDEHGNFAWQHLSLNDL